jgi:pyrimidine deaminase RibD-like protein
MARAVELAERCPPSATMTAYTSMEPCGHRASRPDPCSRLLVDAGVARVVYALGEPLNFVDAPGGDAILRKNGVVVAVMPEFADAAERPNSHLR